MAEVGVDTSRAEAGLKQFGDKLNQTGRSGGQAMAPVRSALGGLEGAAKVATAGIVGLGTAMGIGALVGFGSRMVGAAVDMGRAAEASQRLAGSFEGLASAAGASGSAMLARLQQASGGAIAQYDLMLAANKAMMLGVVSNADDMGKLMEIARVRGTAMGLSVAQAFDNLVTGLGRGSALILDNLGIMVDADATNKEYAASVGKTVEQLTEQEKKQALVNRTLKEATGQTLPAASAYERMSAAMSDMKVELGELFNPAIAAAADLIASGIGVINERVAEGVAANNLSAFNAAKDNMMQAYTGYLAEYNSELAQWEKATETFKAFNPGKDVGEFTPKLDDFSDISQKWSILERQAKAYNEAAEAIGGPKIDIDLLRRGGMETTETTKATDGLADSTTRLTGAVSENARALIDQANKLNVVGSAFEGYSSQLGSLLPQLASELGAGAALSMLDDAEAKARATIAAFEAMGWSQAQIGLVLTSMGDDVAASWDKIASASEEAATKQAAAMAASRAAVEGLHGAQLFAATSANQLGVELHYVGDAGFGAKAGIDSAAQAAIVAQSGFIGLVNAAREASAAMRQAQFDAAGASLKAAYVGAASTLGAGNMYGQYQDAEAALAAYTQQLDASGVSTEEAAFKLEEFKATLTGSIEAQLQTRAASEAARTAAHAASTGLGYTKSEAAKAAGKLGGLSDKAGDLSGKFQSILDKIPGLKGTSEVTDKQMQDAALGVPQNFADDYLRRLTDEVMNGVDWQGVDIGDAAQRAGIDPNLPAQMILELFKNAWADSSLFANPANLDLINMDAVKAGLMQANNAAQGKANIDALFGIGDDATVAAVAGLGLKVQDGLAQWLADNGAPDAGARLAEAIGAGLRDSSGEIGGGLSDATDSYLSSDAGHSAFSNAGKRAAEIFGASMVVRPIIGDPIFSATPNGGSANSGGSDLPPVTGPRPSSGLFGAQSTGATVIVNATVQEPHDIPMLARQVAREIQRRA